MNKLSSDRIVKPQREFIKAWLRCLPYPLQIRCSVVSRIPTLVLDTRVSSKHVLARMTFRLPVKGSWGTKITALVGDILALG